MSLIKNKTAGRIIMVVLLSLPLQGCRKGQDEVKIPWKVEQLAKQIDQTRKTEAYKLPAMPKEKSSSRILSMSCRIASSACANASL